MRSMPSILVSVLSFLAIGTILNLSLPPFLTFPFLLTTSDKAFAAELPLQKEVSQVAGDLSSPTLSGWFSIIWGDGPPGSGQYQEQFLLTDEAGHVTHLSLGEEVILPTEGVVAFNRQRVTITGEYLPKQRQPGDLTLLRVETILPDPSKEITSSSFEESDVAVAYPWVTILCKFSDVNTEAKPLSYFKEMYSSSFPGLAHYWRELSYGHLDLRGSNAVGWFTLPQPRSYYFYDVNGDGRGRLDLDRISADCTRVADPFVHFPDYKGVNLILNHKLDGWSYGGGRLMTLDGVEQFWDMTWITMGNGMNLGLVEHEMGHALGFPHSSGNYGKIYDNQWDVMSDYSTGCLHRGQWHPIYECLGQHTIAYHKDRANWIPSNRKFTAQSDITATLTLQDLASSAGSNYLVAYVPISETRLHHEFYTVEARRLTGYDGLNLPGQAVIIHHVILGRDSPARVIDIDNNGDTGDAGAMWIPGEMFTDVRNNISICVDKSTATGFVVTIGVQRSIHCSSTPDFSFSTLNADTTYIRNGETFTVTTKLVNTGTTAQNVTMAATVPNNTTYVPGSATTSQGTVTGTNSLLFNIGSVAYEVPVYLSFAVTVDSNTENPTLLKGSARISWNGGSLDRSYAIIANSLPLYLPLTVQ